MAFRARAHSDMRDRSVGRPRSEGMRSLLPQAEPLLRNAPTRRGLKATSLLHEGRHGHRTFSLPLRGEGRVRAGARESLPYRCRSAPSARPQRINDRCGRALGALLQSRELRFALAVDLPSPMPRAGGRWNSPQGGRQDAGQWIVRQDALSIHPASRLRPRRGAALGGLSFGYFSLAKQRKVTRAAAAVRKPAVPRDSLRSQASHLAVSLQPETEALGDSLRSPLRAYYALRAPPGLRRDDEHGNRGKRRSRTGCAPTR